MTLRRLNAIPAPYARALAVALTPILLAFLVGAAADDKKDDKSSDADKDKAALKGKWEPVASESGGNKDDEADYKQFRVVFDGDTFTITKSGEAHMKGTYKLDASKSPRQIDMKIEECPDADMKGKSLQGIYELKDDELKWCFVPPNAGDRPKELKSESGTSQILATLKREK